MHLRILALTVLAPAVLTLGACGDNGSTTESGTAGTTGISNPTTGDPTTEGTPTTSGATTGGATTTDGTGTNSMSAGETTTTGETATTTTDATTGSGTTTTTDGTTSDGTTGPLSASSTGSEGTSTTGEPPPPCEPGDSEGMGDVEKSFLWVANTDQGSISKVDTQKLLEIARYRSGPAGAGESPSRTAVSIDGRFVIVNGRMSGRTTMIAANIDDCVDKNGNGMIDTSANKDDLRAWDADECVRWSIVQPIQPNNIGAGPRGVTWTPGTWDMDQCKFVDPKVWVGYLPNIAATAHMVRLDGQTGALEETVVIPNWVQGWSDYGPYGAALDKLKNVWFTGLRGELFRINTANNPATFDRWNPPVSTQSYGMTVDPDGDPWMGGCSGPVSTFDPVTQQFIAIAGTNACHRGLAADKDGSVWVASNGPCGVVQIDHKTNTLIKFHQLNPCSTPVGVSVDLEGFVWLVDEAGWAWKIDPDNVPAMQKVDIVGDHYTYSDMTGGQLKSVILPQ